METKASPVHREPSNKGKVVGKMAPFKIKDIWALRVRLRMENRMCELALDEADQGDAEPLAHEEPASRAVAAWSFQIRIDGEVIRHRSGRRLGYLRTDSPICTQYRLPESRDLTIRRRNASRAALDPARQSHCTDGQLPDAAACSQCRPEAAVEDSLLPISQPRVPSS